MDHGPLVPGPVAPSQPPSQAPEPAYRGPNPKGGLVLATTGVLVAAVLGAFVSAQLAALAIAATLGVAGTWRAVAPRASRAVGIAVRSKALDVILYLGAAAGIAFLALTVPYLD